MLPNKRPPPSLAHTSPLLRLPRCPRHCMALRDKVGAALIKSADAPGDTARWPDSSGTVEDQWPARTPPSTRIAVPLPAPMAMLARASRPYRGGHY